VNREISIIIADDHPIVRKGLREIIEADAQLKVLAEADDGAEAVALVEK
jgi:two-component system nitrate/nitrite response regulator NarP